MVIYVKIIYGSKFHKVIIQDRILFSLIELPHISDKEELPPHFKISRIYNESIVSGVLSAGQS